MNLSLVRHPLVYVRQKFGAEKGRIRKKNLSRNVQSIFAVARMSCFEQKGLP